MFMREPRVDFGYTYFQDFEKFVISSSRVENNHFMVDALFHRLPEMNFLKIK